MHDNRAQRSHVNSQPQFVATKSNEPYGNARTSPNPGAISTRPVVDELHFAEDIPGCPEAVIGEDWMSQYDGEARDHVTYMPPMFHDEDRQPLLRAVMLRHFVDSLARWFDLCDPERHFELVVPQRARKCAPLMLAILCASARHLSRTSQGKRTFERFYPGIFETETAVQFHSEAIQALLALTSNRDEMQNEDLLAAVILLRWYEEIDAPLRGDDQDSELFLRVINLFITQQFVQTPTFSHTSPSTMSLSTPIELTASPDLNTSLHIPLETGLSSYPNTNRAGGLRQASFWVAMRQEIYDCLLKQRSFKIPLSRCAAFRSFTVANDAVWANRMIVFCADCLEFCYGSQEIRDGTSTIPTVANSPVNLVRYRWKELKALEKQWDESIPSTFDPIYTSKPVPSITPRNRIFPELWYLSACHVTGLHHLELARILLMVHDPTPPLLGPGSRASSKQLSSSIQNTVRKMCGMALGNRKLPPALATACLSIAMCGGYFVERYEQEALLEVLDMIEREHGWPFGRTVRRLKEAWGWNEDFGVGTHGPLT